MSARLTLDEAAAELRKTPRWLREWVRAHPRDSAGEPYYTPAGRDKLFHRSDLDRIELALREELKCPSVSGRPARARRRTTKSEEPTSVSAWRSAAELTNDPSLLPNSDASRSVSSSMGGTQHQKLSLIQGGRPS
jgi:hypothetical protein